MPEAMKRVLDAVDVETFLVCKGEEQGKKLAKQLMEELGFRDADIVFLEFQGPGIRVRLRGYLQRPGDNYRWLQI
ncbi:MAG: hypothetical protein UMV23_01435 [Halanaerobium sp.]|nr:hypothetical protein [Halanaerobium sp.]